MLEDYRLSQYDCETCLSKTKALVKLVKHFIEQYTTLFSTKKFKSFDLVDLVVSCLIILYKVGRSLMGTKLFHTTNVERCNISFVYRDVK